MAFDKVIDSAALEAALKASADAIREKTGGSDTIPWDAVKGFADAIAAIEAGGGGAGGVVTGTITPSASTSLTITHNLGKQPNFAALFVTNTSASALSTNWKTCMAIASKYAETIQIEAYSKGGSNYYVNRKNYDPAGATSDAIINNLNDSTFQYTGYEGELQAGNTYRWVVA